MANSWLRLWHDMPNDPKWRTIARLSGQSIALVQAVYVQLMISASQAQERGIYQIGEEDIASALNEDDAAIAAIISAMQKRVLDGQRLTGWEQRQPQKDDSAVGKTYSSNYVYYVAATDSNVVRVGISRNPWARCKDLKSSSHAKFEVLATLKTIEQNDAVILDFFKQSRKTEGWFYKTDALNQLISKTKNKDFNSIDDCISFLQSLSEESFKVDSSNYGSPTSSTKDKEKDKDPDQERKDPPQTPQGAGEEIFDPLNFELPDWLPVELWQAWVRFCVELRKPLKTKSAAVACIKRLDEFRKQGHSVESVITHTIANDWKSFSPPMITTIAGIDFEGSFNRIIVCKKKPINKAEEIARDKYSRSDLRMAKVYDSKKAWCEFLKLAYQETGEQPNQGE
jgi:hypothetical protein